MPKTKKMQAFKPLNHTAAQNRKSKHRYTPLPHCPSQPNPLAKQIENYTLAGLKYMYRTYKYKRTKHTLLKPSLPEVAVFFYTVNPA